MSEETNINLLDFHRIGKGNKNESGNPYDTIDDSIAEYVIENHDIILIAGKPYIYKDGYYKKDSDGNILRALIKPLIVLELRNITRINRIYSLIITNYRLKVDIDEINRHPAHWINFKNGMLDTLTLELHEHDPKYLSINQIPHDYIYADIRNSIVYDFLIEVLPDKEDRQMLLQYIGYCMTVDTGLQRFMVLNGIGGTGKSTILRLVSYMIGKSNISNLSLQDLNERFSATNLFGKILNSCADIPSKAMEQIDVIKKITGEDTIKGEYKGGEVFFFNNYAKLLFSANDIPINLDEKSNAFYRRMLIVKMNKKGTHIPDLEKRLKDEVGIFINMSVQAVHEMYENGGIAESRNSKDAVVELYKQADTALAFIVDELAIDASGRIERGKLYNEYMKYCSENERSPLSNTGFYRNLRNKGYKEAKIRGVRYFNGFKFNNTDFESLQETEQETIFDNNNIGGKRGTFF